MADTREDLLRAMYVAFNARDIDGVLGAMAPDVDWPRAFEGDRVTGQDAVRDYWTQQWSEIDPTVDPVGFSAREDGRVAVEVAQVVKSLDGDVLFDGRVAHVYAFDAATGLVTAMEIETPD